MVVGGYIAHHQVHTVTRYPGKFLPITCATHGQ